MLGLALTACDRSPAPIREALGPDPTAHTTLRLMTSVDQGASWRLAPQTIAHGVSSLHACTHDGTVWVPAILDVTKISWLESAFPSPFVDVFRSRDLVTWTADRVPIRSSRTGGIDPACVVGPTGLEMWFAEVAGIEGDPALGGRTSQIWRTHWTGKVFGDGDVVFTGSGVVDPAPIYDGAGLRLFLNQDAVRVVEVIEDAVVPVWNGVTVPQAADLVDTQVLVAQRVRGPDRTPVLRTLSRRGLGPANEVVIQPGLQSCGSPSLTTLGDTWLLFCVDRPAGGRGHPQPGRPR